MSGFIRVPGGFTLLMSLVLVSIPLSLTAQTAEERAKEREIRQRLEVIQEKLQLEQAEEMARLEMRLQAVKEHQLALVQEQLQGSQQQELARVEEALVRAKREFAEQKLQLQEVREKQMAEQMAMVERARQRTDEALFLNQERVREREARAQAALRELQEARIRMREGDGKIRVRVRDALQKAQEQVRRAQEIMIQVRSRVRLGVSLNGNQGEEYDTQGARLAGIIEDSPAEEAGLEEGDIITHLNGQSLLQAIPDEDEEEFDEDESLPVQRLMALAQELDAGDEVVVRYLRDGQASSVTFEAADVEEPAFRIYRGGEGDEERAFTIFRGGEGDREAFRGMLRVEPEGKVWHFDLPEGKEWTFNMDTLDIKTLKLEGLEALEDLEIKAPSIAWKSFEDSPFSKQGVYAFRGGDEPLSYFISGRMGSSGLELTELNPGLAQYFSTNSGILVLDVDEDSTLGLQAGDVILSIDGREVEEMRDIRRILSSYEEDEEVSFTIMRSGQRTTVEGTIK